AGTSRPAAATATRAAARAGVSGLIFRNSGLAVAGDGPACRPENGGGARACAAAGEKRGGAPGGARGAPRKGRGGTWPWRGWGGGGAGGLGVPSVGSGGIGGGEPNPAGERPTAASVADRSRGGKARVVPEKHAGERRGRKRRLGIGLRDFAREEGPREGAD